MVEWQAIAAIADTSVAIVTLFVGWIYLLLRIVRDDVQDLREDMRTMEQRLIDRIDHNHQELLAYLRGHTHADGSPPVFRELLDSAG